jgi:cell division protein FtsB
MSLDGLRAWIGILERKLTMRTRVFLVLIAIAIGGAGAGIYLGAEAQSDQVTAGDLQAVQDELGARIEALETRVESLEGEARVK